MADRPTSLELLAAVRRFLDEELIPGLDGVKRFHTLVASNALGIVAREFEDGAASQREQYLGLGRLLGLEDPPPAEPEALARALDERERALVARIRAGEADAGPFRAELLAELEAGVRRRLAIDNPRYR